MKTLAIPAIVALCMIGCSSKIKVPEGTSVHYENHFVGSKVVAGKPLADEIIAKLNDEPDYAGKNVEMTLNTRKSLHVGTRIFAVTADELILIDDWGVRTWSFKGIEARLEALIAKAPNKLDAGDGE